MVQQKRFRDTDVEVGHAAVSGYSGSLVPPIPVDQIFRQGAIGFYSSRGDTHDKASRHILLYGYITNASIRQR